MPEFCSSLVAAKAGEKLTHSELIRAIRFMVAAEYEAVGLYTQLADSVDCAKTKAVLADIADEELVHAGEFLRLLKELAPNEPDLYADGAKEVEELFEKLEGESSGY
ncbi:MAG: ferritin family protein [Victivallaceae bacterium]